MRSLSSASPNGVGVPDGDVGRDGRRALVDAREAALDADHAGFVERAGRDERPPSEREESEEGEERRSDRSAPAVEQQRPNGARHRPLSVAFGLGPVAPLVRSPRRGGASGRPRPAAAHRNDLIPGRGSAGMANDSASTDRGVGVAVLFALLGLAGALAMYVAPTQVVSGWAFAAAMVAGTVLVAAIHLAG
jgi:hypothetical protein